MESSARMISAGLQGISASLAAKMAPAVDSSRAIVASDPVAVSDTPAMNDNTIRTVTTRQR